MFFLPISFLHSTGVLGNHCDSNNRARIHTQFENFHFQLHIRMHTLKLAHQNQSASHVYRILLSLSLFFFKLHGNIPILSNKKNYKLHFTTIHLKRFRYGMEWICIQELKCVQCSVYIYFPVCFTFSVLYLCYHRIVWVFVELSC